MIIDLNEVKNKLYSSGSALVNYGYLKNDMLVMYDYYKDSEKKSPLMEIYFSEHQDFDVKEFTECYLSTLFNTNVTLGDESNDLIRINQN